MMHLKERLVVMDKVMKKDIFKQMLSELKNQMVRTQSNKLSV